jgi:hypothetical protein
VDDFDLDLIKGAFERFDGERQWGNINFVDVGEDKELRESKYSSKQPEGRGKVLLNGLKIEQLANEVNHEVLDKHVERNGQ